MKKFLLMVTVSVISCSFVKSQEKLSADQKAVQQTIIKVFEALSNRDSVNLKANCTSDVILLEYGLVWNIDTLITRAIKQNPFTDFKRINTIDFINTKVDKNVAWTTYYNQADITQNGNHRMIKWIETVVLVKERKGWKVKVLHSTSIKRN